MLDSRIGVSVLEAQLELRTASIQLVDIDLYAPFHNTLHEPQCYRLDLCLTSSRAGARARFMQHWSADRYEPAGRLFLLPPGEAMQLRSDPGSLKVLVCRLPIEFLLTVFDDDFRPTHGRLEASLNVLNPSIRHLLGRIATEISHPGLDRDILIEALGLQLAVELRRYYADIEESFVSNGLDAWRLRLIDARIEEGGPTPSVSELASLCSMSVRQLARSFRASRDISLGRYLANRRMEQAKASLATGCAVKAVAHSMGYSSVASFCYAFRKTVGITPGQYKSQIPVRG